MAEAQVLLSINESRKVNTERAIFLCLFLYLSGQIPIKNIVHIRKNSWVHFFPGENAPFLAIDLFADMLK